MAVSFDLTLDGGQAHAGIPGQFLHPIQPPGQQVVSLPLLLGRRPGPVKQRPVQGHPHPPGELAALQAGGEGAVVHVQVRRRLARPLVPHQLVQ